MPRQEGGARTQREKPCIGITWKKEWTLWLDFGASGLRFWMQGFRVQGLGFWV